MKRVWIVATIAALSAVPAVRGGAFAPARDAPARSAQAGSQAVAVLPAGAPADIHPISLTEAQLASGRQQVDQMLHDCPAMAEYARSGDPLYTWVVRQMAGGAVGDLVLWSGDIGDYPAQFNACHRPPIGNVKGQIMLRRQFASGPLKGKPIPADALWSGFVFELFNISNTQSLLANNQAAIDGKITRQEFITEGARNEFKAVAKTAAFYRQFWRPLTTYRHLRSDAVSWQDSEPTAFDQWISLYTDPAQYPNGYWGVYYDEKIVPYQKAMEAYRKQYGKQN